MSAFPPLLPKVDAVLVFDGDGTRLAGKYYGDFLKKQQGEKSLEETQTMFEKSLQQKIGGIAARPDAAEIVTVMGRTAAFAGGVNPGGGGGGDVRVVHVGPPGESELVLAYLCEGMYDALAHLMGGSTDRTMVLDNLELVFLLIDEHCDGGIILETDGSKLASAVLLRDDEGMQEGGMDQGGMPQGASQQGLPPGVSAGDMTIGQAFRQARAQFLGN
ncbi:Coatomer subunit zeta [Seminavis robusta]|uniref:Coatomer subunit zeta n=1 Tax=Seminavis robusta TaxID=568900 RepID=A0A9N8H6E4_9STRA|nr:Coatomer subunit zeta [Seminavis robusta]|eukprot:Sro110_g054760.1 Coatomer subunit zeta (217) ;mRNA; r:15878-16876